MTTAALAFMLGSWGCVLGLTGWAFWRILGADARKPPSNL